MHFETTMQRNVGTTVSEKEDIVNTGHYVSLEGL